MHRLDMTLPVAEALSPNKPNQPKLNQTKPPYAYNFLCIFFSFQLTGFLNGSVVGIRPLCTLYIVPAIIDGQFEW